MGTLHGRDWLSSRTVLYILCVVRVFAEKNWHFSHDNKWESKIKYFSRVKTFKKMLKLWRFFGEILGPKWNLLQSIKHLSSTRKITCFLSFFWKVRDKHLLRLNENSFSQFLSFFFKLRKLFAPLAKREVNLNSHASLCRLLKKVLQL